VLVSIFVKPCLGIPRQTRTGRNRNGCHGRSDLH
jgi:hypothetical protein